MRKEKRKHKGFREAKPGAPLLEQMFGDEVPDVDLSEVARAQQPPPSGGVLEGIVAQLGGAWGRFVADLQALDCRPRCQQLKIDGLVYTSEKWPASIGLELWPRLVALLGPGLAAALSRGEDIGELGIDVVVRVAQAAMAHGLLPLVRDTLRSMSCSALHTTAKPGEVLDDFDSHFAGEYEHLARVCLFALVHNLRGPTKGAR